MYLLAQDYENEGNFDNAFFWYNKAAMQGLADGINNVAMYYLEGLVVTPDVDKTINLLESIADKVPVAKINLACIYLEGKGCPQDSEKGMELLRHAVSGVDYKIAIKWFEKAYALEIYESVEILCNLYEGLYSRKVKNRENIIINNKKVYPDFLVARTFLPNMNPELYTEVEHIDGDMSNNSTRNLRWIKKK